MNTNICIPPTEITVNDQKVSLEELEEMKKDSKFRLKEIGPNTFRKLEKLHG